MTDEFACHIGLPKAGSTFLQHNIFPVLFPEVPSHPFEDYGWQTDTNYAMALLFDDNTPDPDGPLFSTSGCQLLSRILTPVGIIF